MLSCPTTTIGTEKRASILKDALAAAVERKEVALVQLQAALSGRVLIYSTL